MVLALGYVLVIVLAVLLTSTLSSLHLERQRLIALANSAALVAADYAGGQGYLDSLAKKEPGAQAAGATRAVADFLGQAPAASGFASLTLVSVTEDGTGRVVVELATDRSLLAAFDLSGRQLLTVHLREAGAATTLE